MSEALGEDVSKPSCSSGSKADTTMARIRCSMDQSFLKNKSGRGGTTDLLDPQQHVWRPQRGLPERAVAILKAWLFEHFLHPYVCLYVSISCSVTPFLYSTQTFGFNIVAFLLFNFFSVTLQTPINTCWLVKRVYHGIRWGPFPSNSLLCLYPFYSVDSILIIIDICSRSQFNVLFI